MELQEFSPHLLISQVRLKSPHPVLFDKRGALIEELREMLEAPEWAYQQDGLQVSSSDGRELFRLTVSEAYVSLENFEDFEAAVEKTRRFLGFALEALGEPDITWMGVRSHDLAPADSLDSLREHMVEGLSAPLADLSGLVGKQPTDVGWVVEFHGEDPRITVRLGPMVPEQATAVFFRDKDESRFPPQFLFLDVDRVLADSTFSSAEVLERWEASLTKARAITARLADWLTELT